ncbi:MAG: peptidyl-prolyl cis-trans isomerase, partial [Gammaproteobacteria bacterium]|nr:peptidyl-prolyl cis-trans isomerase [Gammaproteobacteria bacterium]
FSSFANSQINVSQTAIQNFYNQHIKEFQKPEVVSVEYILLSAKDLISKIHPTDTELLKYYNESPESFNLPAQWKFISILIPTEKTTLSDSYKSAEMKANDVYKKAEQGKDLTALVKEDSISIDNTYSKTFTPLNNIPKEIQNALSNVTTPNEFIKPIQVSKGFLIVKVIDYKKSEPQSFDKVKDQVKAAVILQQSEEQLAAAKEKLANITYEHPASLKPAAEALGLPIQTTTLFSKDKGNDEISNNFKVREAAFSSDVLNALNNSDVIPINNNTVVVLRIKSHSPTMPSPLSEVQQQIAEKLKTLEIETRASKLATKIIAQLKTGATPESIAKEYNVNWINSGLVARHSTKVDPAILDQAFDLPNTDKSYGIAKMTNGYAIVNLKSIQNGALNHSEDYNVFAEQIQNTQGLLEYQLYKQSLMKKANIIIE